MPTSARSLLARDSTSPCLRAQYTQLTEETGEAHLCDLGQPTRICHLQREGPG